MALSFRQRANSTHARATHYPAGVRTMRARICSAFSCDMFARVVWLKPRRAAKLPTFALSRSARSRHAWLVRLTRARRQWFARRTAQVLLADFWYFSSSKSTLIKSILKYFSGHRNATPYKRYSSSTVRTKSIKKTPASNKACRSFSYHNSLFYLSAFAFGLYFSAKSETPSFMTFICVLR